MHRTTRLPMTPEGPSPPVIGFVVVVGGPHIGSHQPLYPGHQRLGAFHGSLADGLPDDLGVVMTCTAEDARIERVDDDRIVRHDHRVIAESPVIDNDIVYIDRLPLMIKLVSYGNDTALWPRATGATRPLTLGGDP